MFNGHEHGKKGAVCKKKIKRIRQRVTKGKKKTMVTKTDVR